MVHHTCKENDCVNPVQARGMCSKHYTRASRAGKLEPVKPRSCQVEACDNKHHGKGYCRLHLDRLKRTGSPHLAEREVKFCSVVGCGLAVYGRGYCNKHWQQSRSGIKPGVERDLDKLDAPADCLVCGSSHDGSSGLMEFCTRRCYYRWNRSGGTFQSSKKCVDCGEEFSLLAATESARATRANTVRCLKCRNEPWGGWCMTASEIAARDGWVCAIGGEPIDLKLKYPDPGAGTVDHIIPRSRGGKDVPDNVQLACWFHNRWKSDKLPDELDDLVSR